MKEKPIIFSAKMIQALLNTKPDVWPAERIDAGKPFKSMTRRVILPQPEYQLKEYRGKWHEYNENPLADPRSGSPWGRGYVCKHNAGDILWIRETFCQNYFDDGSPAYKADYNKSKLGDVIPEPKWKSPIFMPRDNTRLYLLIKNIRVERLQKISEEDALDEGILSIEEPGYYGALPSFINLWDSLNAKRGYSWDSNPWVWVYEFMRIK